MTLLLARHHLTLMLTLLGLTAAASPNFAVGAPGVLQLQVEGFYNPHGRDAAGRCCSLPANSTASRPAVCPGHCNTFFRVCAARVGPNWPDEPDLRQHTLACPLGLLVTPAVANDTLDPQRDGLLLMRFPYREWPGKLKLVFEAWHDVTGSLFAQNPTHDTLEAESVARLILRLERRHRLIPGEDWLRRSVHVSLPKGDSPRRPARRISVTYALRLIGVSKPTPQPDITFPSDLSGEFTTQASDMSFTERIGASTNTPTTQRILTSTDTSTTEQISTASSPTTQRIVTTTTPTTERIITTSAPTTQRIVTTLSPSTTERIISTTSPTTQRIVTTTTPTTERIITTSSPTTQRIVTTITPTTERIITTYSSPTTQRVATTNSLTTQQLVTTSSSTTEWTEATTSPSSESTVEIDAATVSAVEMDTAPESSAATTTQREPDDSTGGEELMAVTDDFEDARTKDEDPSPPLYPSASVHLGTEENASDESGSIEALSTESNFVTEASDQDYSTVVSTNDVTMSPMGISDGMSTDTAAAQTDESLVADSQIPDATNVKYEDTVAEMHSLAEASNNSTTKRNIKSRVLNIFNW